MLIGRTSLSIHKLCEGPFHVDYQLVNNRSEIGIFGIICRGNPTARISFNCTIEQQAVWSLKFVKSVVHVKYSNELNLVNGNYWSLLISRSRNDGEDTFNSTDKSIPAVTTHLTDLDEEKKVCFVWYLE